MTPMEEKARRIALRIDHTADAIEKALLSFAKETREATIRECAETVSEKSLWLSAQVQKLLKPETDETEKIK